MCVEAMTFPICIDGFTVLRGERMERRINLFSVGDEDTSCRTKWLYFFLLVFYPKQERMKLPSTQHLSIVLRGNNDHLYR